jgi:hypothetical protein
MTHSNSTPLSYAQLWSYAGIYTGQPESCVTSYPDDGDRDGPLSVGNF